MAILMEEVVEPLKRKSMQSEKKWHVYARLLRKSIPVLILPLALYCMSCGSPRNATGHLPKPVEIPKLIPVEIPPDSAWLRAYLACDSNNRVIMKAFEEQKGRRTESSLSLDSGGVLEYHANSRPDTIYVQGKDSIIYQPVEVPGPVTNVLTWWQELWIRLGKLLVVGIAIRYIIRRFK